MHVLDGSSIPGPKILWYTDAELCNEAHFAPHLQYQLSDIEPLATHSSRSERWFPVILVFASLNHSVPTLSLDSQRGTVGTFEHFIFLSQSFLDLTVSLLEGSRIHDRHG